MRVQVLGIGFILLGFLFCCIEALDAIPYSRVPSLPFPTLALFCGIVGIVLVIGGSFKDGRE